MPRLSERERHEAVGMLRAGMSLTQVLQGTSTVLEAIFNDF